MSGSLDLHLAIAKRREEHPQHWILVLCPSGSVRGTYYHVKGGPTQGVEYEVHIEANKRLDSTGIESTTQITTMSAAEQKKVVAAARAVPAQYCQTYVIGVLERLEDKELVPAGTVKRYTDIVERK